MGQVFAAFGIDWRLLIINALNFGILLFALWYFLYGPLMRILEERRTRVLDGVRDAESAAHTLEEIERSRVERLAQAGREADEVLVRARAAGEIKERELLAEAETAAARALAEGQAQARDLKEQAIAESKKEVAKLVVLGVEKMLTQT